MSVKQSSPGQGAASLLWSLQLAAKSGSLGRASTELGADFRPLLTPIPLYKEGKIHVSTFKTRDFPQLTFHFLVDRATTV